ncbi:TPA: PTS sugar transporter subunit IIB [Streptococcus equi subsp. zooepidemicus]|uniref:Cellobiose-specific phosphotransferase enzyme IIB component n=3 Tax=Streptococcus equi subsp. zooepidemicus TaxID=40041 RepID=B4U3Q2_STREM|nr:PTS sugar transporter subunit IIB [Streptococcus equi]KIS17173.1 lactose/cellobiose-specific phosphotransferase system (PTS), IIB component [Streptococcus equi subsp. zooepidemicus Sz4is]ACG62619.1 cellobiose-specific phosphotransferase enzyme IIB component [Streptococcus equi subsp. zooepidemicus MGCS10565]EQB23489.1 lactose/cellobiose-specific phosphotransferase system (PTS), IIB component [Streptococcus equi subsp. zooepidemicus SzS31A1]KIS05885.1 lactose/cellobiose-specific phosphotransf
MKTIMLVCNAGMSTSMLVTKMQKAAQARGIEIEIWAVPVSEADNEVAAKTIDVLMLGPQVKFLLKDFKTKFEPAIKVDVINMADYGLMNGDKVLETALTMMEEEV